MRNLLRLCLLTGLLLTVPSLSFAAKTHKVKKKDSLVSLAKKYHVTVDQLKSANNIVRNVKPGDVIVIPPRSVHDEPRQGTTSYRVRKGDTIATVSKKTGVSVADLKKLNGLSGKKLRPGQVLALRRSEGDEGGIRQVASVRPARLSRTLELMKEDEYEKTLSELTSDLKPAELTHNIELKSDNTAALKKTAYSFLGTRYRFGGNTRKGLDCSSFVQHVFRELDVDLPRTAREQFSVGDAVAPTELKKGDLVFFHTYARYPSHVGIYLGENRMIHASSRDRRVVISTMNTPYYLSRFIGAKRIGKINPDIFNLSELLVEAEVENESDVLANDTLGIGTN